MRKLNNHRPSIMQHKEFPSVICFASGILLNVALAFLVHFLDLPMYLDTIGTIAVAALSGPFPGIATAVVTNVVCTLFNNGSVYFAILNVLISLISFYFFRTRLLKKPGFVILWILILTLISGGLGGIIQWALLGSPQFASIADASEVFAETTGMSRLTAFLIINILVNLIDKTISCLAALLIIKNLPEKIRNAIEEGGWKQRPLSHDDLNEMRKLGQKKSSLQQRMSRMMIFAATSMTIVMACVSIYLYNNNAREEQTQAAKEAAALSAKLINPAKVRDYLEEGRDAPGYAETESMLYTIRDQLPSIAYLYVVQIREDGCHFIFDLETSDTPANEPGTIVPFEEAFEPYLPALFAGDPIPPIESNDVSGWVITVYQPVYDSARNCVCYVGADVFMSYLSSYVKDYLLRTLLIFSGFFFLVVGYALWVSGYRVVYPINAMAATTNSFVYDSTDKDTQNDNTHKIKNLEITTGDEIEKLYNAITKMTMDTAEQIKDIRHQARAITQMQEGLIITMADMVENRDSDTGAHVQKTAAYVRIILEGLKKKGYYEKKLTDKFMMDVETSAPLHDVGKISISDTILNKPGKLTDKEFEIMKTHTTAGKEIMEKVIDRVQGENYLKEARNMAAYHHEKWDGSGYPEGLYGEVIPLSARVMAVADVFDALSSKRVYKDAMPFEKAMSIIEEGSGTHFDPKCVEVFLESQKEVKTVLKKYNT
ncbi:MAG: HD domain-containing protein [Lachnospiraceae bacterium]|nr:HD domain-containing protein [Lachnospiraceae bacterium]